MKQLRPKLFVFILAVGVFGILNTEMGVVGILPQVSARFGVSVPEAGLLVSGFALIVAIAGPTMPLLFSKLNRKAVMLLSLGVFSVCNVAAIFAPSFPVLLAARVIPAAFHPLYVSMAMAVAGSLGETEAERARGASRVFIGVSAGMVLGAPVASFLASTAALEFALAFFAIVTVAVFTATLALVPSMPVEQPLSYGRQLAILKKPVLIASFLAVLFINGAMFGFYSYLSDYLGILPGLGATGVSALLLVYGGMNIVGNVIAGRVLAENPVRSMLVAPAVLVTLYLALFAAGQLTVPAAILLAVLGIAAGAANTIDQYLVAHAAPEAPDFSNGLYLTAANLGTTVGTSFCGAFITALGTAQFALIGSLVFLAAGIACTVARVRIAAESAKAGETAGAAAR